MMNSVSKTMICVLRTRNFVLKQGTIERDEFFRAAKHLGWAGDDEELEEVRKK